MRFKGALLTSILLGACARTPAPAPAQSVAVGPPCFDRAATPPDERKGFPGQPVTPEDAAAICALFANHPALEQHRIVSARYPNALISRPDTGYPIDVFLPHRENPSLSLRAVVEPGPQGLAIRHVWSLLEGAALTQVTPDEAREVVKRLETEGWNVHLERLRDCSGKLGGDSKKWARSVREISARDGLDPRWRSMMPPEARYFVVLADKCQPWPPVVLTNLFVGDAGVLLSVQSEDIL